MTVCYLCRKPTATLMLTAKGGYADGPRPCCYACYDEDRYTRHRFVATPIRWTRRPPWMQRVLAEWRYRPQAELA